MQTRLLEPDLPRLLLLAMTVALALFAPPSASGQERLHTASVRHFLEAVAVGGEPVLRGRMLQSPQGVATFYAAINYRHVWTGDGPLAEALEELVQETASATDHGLSSGRYHLEALQQALSAQRATLAAEVLATDAFLTQARHRAVGVVDPLELDAEWQLVREPFDEVALLLSVLERGAGVSNALQSLWPAHREYRTLLSERARIGALRDDDSVQVPPGPLIRPGDSGPRVVRLKQRLLGPGEYSETYDEPLRVAVIAFQQSSGIDTDGVVGPATLEILNASRFSWIDRIDANLERWRWLPGSVPDTHLRINIAAFRLRAIRDGREQLAMDVIVGRPYRRTPVFQRDLRYLVVNPFWNIPTSIAVRDKLPLLQSDPEALAAQGYEARASDAEAFVPVTDIDWQPVSRGRFGYQLRQRPGPGNALGYLKFMLPNEHAVYLHGTPDTRLFDKQERGFSSGCVRLADPAGLARWVLALDDNDAAAAGLDEQIASGETLVHYLKTPIPVMIVYFTAFLEGGKVQFRRDLYSRDAAIVSALRRNH